MAPWLTAVIGGVAGGLVAALAMNLFQGAAASLFAQGGGGGDPATVKAADDAKRAVGAPPVTQKRRAEAGSLVHHGLGAALGLLYGLLVPYWPPASVGFGVTFGIAVALILDDLLVPAFGWGEWPWRTTLATNLYGLSSHIVFGAVLEGVRRLAGAVLG